MYSIFCILLMSTTFVSGIDWTVVVCWLTIGPLCPLSDADASNKTSATIGASDSGSRTITVVNRCNYPIWINPHTSEEGPPLGPISKMGPSAQITYNIPDSGWEGLFWPKTGCDDSGQNCAAGQSLKPCPTGGCQPPADTKVEFFFPEIGDTKTIYYDVSLVDGYTLPMEIIPSTQQGTCVTTNCAMSLDACPTNENVVGDLRVTKDGKVVQCLAPCKKWNYPAPYGMNKPDKEDIGLEYCCPTPPVSVEQCRAGQITKTGYVNLIRRECPTAYTYAYDDEGGNHDCPNPTNFNVNIC